MAVGKMFNTLTFGGINSGDYDVYITGSGVYDAPARDVEMITVPGRHGQYAVDQGRFEQLEITYPATIAKKHASEFAEIIRQFRNALASQIGYQRLEDDYNPDEYRMGVFMSGIEVKPTFKRTGEFDLTFTCMPQRWLKAGEEDIVLTADGTVNNPYPYTASPLYRMYGTGTVKIGSNFSITNAADPIGEQTLNPASATVDDYVITYDESIYRTGDVITVGGMAWRWTITPKSGWKLEWGSEDEEIPIATSQEDGDSATYTKDSDGALNVLMTVVPFTFSQGTRDAHTLQSYRIVTSTSPSGEVTQRYFKTVISVSYDGKHTIRAIYDESNNRPDGTDFLSVNGTTSAVTAYSSKSSLGEPLYIDADIGEAYTINEEGVKVSRNAWAKLGVQLPVLPPGDTVIDMESTVSRLEITPRWWIV